MIKIIPLLMIAYVPGTHGCFNVREFFSDSTCGGEVSPYGTHFQDTDLFIIQSNSPIDCEPWQEPDYGQADVGAPI